MKRGRAPAAAVVRRPQAPPPRLRTGPNRSRPDRTFHAGGVERRRHERGLSPWPRSRCASRRRHRQDARPADAVPAPVRGAVGARRQPLSPRALCALTFTDKAAGEMRERLQRRVSAIATAVAAADGDEARAAALQELPEIELVQTAAALGRPVPGLLLWEKVLAQLPGAPIGTFHSFAASLLRRNAGVAGLDPDFVLLDEDSARALLLEAGERVLLGRSKGGSRTPRRRTTALPRRRSLPRRPRSSSASTASAAARAPKAAPSKRYAACTSSAPKRARTPPVSPTAIANWRCSPRCRVSARRCSAGSPRSLALLRRSARAARSGWASSPRSPGRWRRAWPTSRRLTSRRRCRCASSSFRGCGKLRVKKDAPAAQEELAHTRERIKAAVAETQALRAKLARRPPGPGPGAPAGAAGRGL